MHINVRLINMDVQVAEHVVLNCDDSATIFLNARHTAERQREAYLHAMEHLVRDDFFKNDVDEVELRSHAI